ncbi:MAG: hypothetical protein NC111_02115 [Bacteroides sp.]|nr:hypothetical protein [Bacteroides sp.]MCM1413477.1 hypothetical protein [Bacteroides sp.]MCM1471312.1 hypothetical protein [Bacteroides sp.]
MTDSRAIIKTLPYKLTPAAYFKVAAGSIIPTFAALSILIVLVAGALAVIFDLRILLVALILLFLVIPFIVANIYFSRLLSPSAQKAIHLKSVEIVPFTSISETLISDNGPDNVTCRTIHYPWSTVKSIRQTSKQIIITLTPDNYTLIVPLDTVDPVYDC